MATADFKLRRGTSEMGRIVVSVRIENVADPKFALRCDALVDTGAAHLVLPTAWKERLGELEVIGTVDVEVADQSILQAEVCGPVKIQIDGFRPVFNEILF